MQRKKRRSSSSNSFSRVSSSLETNKNTSKTSTYCVLPFSNRRILGGGDTLLDRRCTNCDTTSTPLWRNGPRGPKSLCNACGIRFKKEEKRTINPVVTAGSTGAQDQYGQQHHSSYSNYNDVENGSSSTCNFVASEIMFNHDYYGGAGEYYRRDPVDGVNGLTSNTWRLNVADTATSLVYDFTR
ncbi:unnamed protein product [Eruca vesicaria subsp. sativa]|uniref:GATA-type domain-containing protein n=1 Tax=Eruca vesicaria subsp. sativa TaxID=29727 RepID=A0ABC8KAM5_ERUVS|nr:unnamed protein product [Eruca vesicaria subsp. sativa]